MRRKPLDSSAAEAIAIQALSFLAADPERLERFLAATGLLPERLRAATAAPDFWAGLLDHMVSDDELLIQFAKDSRIPPEEVMAARQVLSPVME